MGTTQILVIDDEEGLRHMLATFLAKEGYAVTLANGADALARAKESRHAVGIEIAFILGIVMVYLAKREVTDIIDDERYVKITEQATIRTMQVFWVVFCAFSIGAVMQILHIPTFPREPPGSRPPVIIGPRMIGYIQLGLLCLMIFLYVGFRIYYAKKYGDFETDEE